MASSIMEQREQPLINFEAVGSLVPPVNLVDRDTCR